MPPSHDMMRVFNIGDVEEKSKRTKTIEKWERKKSLGRAEWQTNFYFRRYLKARRAKKKRYCHTTPLNSIFSSCYSTILGVSWGVVWTSRQSMSPFASIVTSATSHHPITFLAIKIILHKEGMLSVSVWEQSPVALHDCKLEMHDATRAA